MNTISAWRGFGRCEIWPNYHVGIKLSPATREIGLLRRNSDSDARERHAWSPAFRADYRGSHSVAISGDPRPDDVRSSDIAAQFVCRACGKRDADVRPDFNWMSGQPMPR